MSREYWDTRRDAATEFAADMSDRPAKPGAFGFCIYGDAPPAIGGGTPWFYWFEDAEEMCAAIATHAASIYPAPAGIDLDRVDVEVSRLAVCGRDDHELMRVELNKVLKGSAQFDWIGSFNDLCTDDKPFSKQVRSEFREEASERGEADARAIAQAEVDAFIEFLGSYGV